MPFDIQAQQGFILFSQTCHLSRYNACMNARQERLGQALEKILRTLAAEYFPEKVIIFGSMANDSVGEWSDLDLVIIKDTAKPFLQRLREVALLCRPSVGVDFLVYTPREFSDMIADRNPFIIEEVLSKGKVLYERQSGTSMA
jgi:predicted nucleotidyltransferase